MPDIFPHVLVESNNTCDRLDSICLSGTVQNMRRAIIRPLKCELCFCAVNQIDWNERSLGVRDVFLDEPMALGVLNCISYGQNGTDDVGNQKLAWCRAIPRYLVWLYIPFYA